ncbi:MAG: DUF481 domain-containing protein [Planctomycetes bacterium]|nr:DUF481 domain-containing protein [Planctomycetota bacterium]
MISAILAISLLIFNPDEVVFKNGEKIVGKITNVADGKITIQSDSLGSVTAPLDKVATFSADQPLDLVLKGGLVKVNSKVDAVGEGNIQLSKDSPLPGAKFTIKDIDKINPTPVKWNGSIVASYVSTRGNSDADNAGIDINAQRRGEDDRMTFGAGYAETRTKDTSTHEFKTTTERYFGGLQYDYFFSPTFYGYANARVEKDRIQFLDLRLLAGAGAGQQWEETGEFKFSTEEGLSWLSENYSNSTPSVDTITARIAYHLLGKPAASITLFHDAEWYPGLEDHDTQIVIADLGLNASLTKSMFFQAKMEVHYNNTPATGADRSDWRYTLGLGWTF